MNTIAEGSTAGLVKLSRTDSGVFVLDLCGHESNNKENRWILPFCEAIHKAFDTIEEHLARDGGGSPAALLTISSAGKFFSNGIDPAWFLNPETPKDDKDHWQDLTMPAFARPILLPVPTVCAVSGHCFGAGMMFALGHDHRLQSTGRGYICANEIEIGFPTPLPEFTLFSHSIPNDAYYSTILEAKRWKAEEAERKGVIQKAVAPEKLYEESLKVAEKLANLTVAGVVGYTKWGTKGHVAKEIFHHNFPKGAKRSPQPLSSGLERWVNMLVVEDKNPEYFSNFMSANL
mmetsp:Transcript_8416/g.12705  ORF Transcript_8416/g.12705 Transcript_8416/m.12705 type:complete len:289 (-) Transcript_8416:912-1778(-)